MSKDRLEVVRREEATLKDKLYPLEMEYNKEKSILEEIRQLQRKKEELDEKEQRAELRNELAIVADIRYRTTDRFCLYGGRRKRVSHLHTHHIWSQ